VPVDEGSLPYAPVVEVLRALVAELGPDAVRELVGPSWPELARLAPGLPTLQDIACGATTGTGARRPTWTGSSSGWCPTPTPNWTRCATTRPT
jgi:hypothetical protein